VTGAVAKQARMPYPVEITRLVVLDVSIFERNTTKNNPAACARSRNVSFVVFENSFER